MVAESRERLGLDDPNGELSLAIVEKSALSIVGDLTKAEIFYVR